MGDPTEPTKREESHDLHQSDNDMPVEDSDNEDFEAEQVQPAVVANNNTLSSQNAHNQRSQGNRTHNSNNIDTVHSILSSISNPNAAVVIPVDGSADGEEEIDADRMERFYTGALSAITKMRKQTVKAETKIDTLRDEVGHATMQAWTDEHYESLQKAAGDK